MSSLPAPTIGTLLKRYRRAAGLTQEALAEQAGISADTISELERGVNLRPRTDTLGRLADAWHLSPPQHAQLQEAARGLLPPGKPGVVPLRLAAVSASLPPLIGRGQKLMRLARQEALSNLGGERAIALLLEALEQGQPILRNRVARELGKRKLVRAVEPLLAAWQSNPPDQRDGVIWALGH
jgi:transcriptional regulator with XRE-family HTH domain